MILATVDTGHFKWTALAYTRNQADRLLLKAWERHQKTSLAVDPQLMWDLIVADEVNYTSLAPGTVFRDDHPIVTPVLF